MWTHGPGSVHEFPPWVLSAYAIAVKHGYAGTEREFRLALLGADGEEMRPAIYVTDLDEEEIPAEEEMAMRSSDDSHAYSTDKNEFRSADEILQVPDGLTVSGRVLRLTCEGEAMGTACTLPDAELPAVSAEDNGKIMKVVSGSWAAAAF